MGCLDHVRGHGDQVHVTGSSEEGWSWRRWGNWPSLQQQQVSACLWPVAKCRGGLGLIQLSKQNALPSWLFHISSTLVQSTSFLFPTKRFFIFFFFFFSLPPPSPHFSPIQTRWPWKPWLLHAAMVMWEAALGTGPEGPGSCQDGENKVKIKHTHGHICTRVPPAMSPVLSRIQLCLLCNSNLQES